MPFLVCPLILCQDGPDGPRTAGPRTEGTTMRSNRTVTAQVALEAIVDNLEAYDTETVIAVHREAVDAGVAPMYVDMLVERLSQARVL